jgi:hypothetical protein
MGPCVTTTLTREQLLQAVIGKADNFTTADKCWPALQVELGIWDTIRWANNFCVGRACSQTMWHWTVPLPIRRTSHFCSETCTELA